ncbi:DUF6719 family protein [Bradyrhizobium campsiandrae]|uniref:DUF6719 family protein n=1 Tax=Bradyrhizobium campsiandrae TaxID=1729892 RepID=UPI0034D175EA
MKKLLFAIVILLTTTAAHAQLTSEPAPGTLPSGQSVLVDDGTCGPGKIKKVTGGSDVNMATGERQKGSGRKRTCIKKP